MPCGRTETTSIRLDYLPSTMTLFPVFIIESYDSNAKIYHLIIIIIV